MNHFFPATPIFRILDEPQAREFYLDYLGFELDFEHRFAPGMPIYIGVRRGEFRLHLTEHEGGCGPGSAARGEVADIQSLASELDAKGSRFANPSIQEQPWGSMELDVRDPFGNRLTFFQAIDPHPE